jgi:hypothetical protein
MPRVMKYPKYLYRGTTTNYIGPLGMINVDPNSRRIYFSVSPDEARVYAQIHRDPTDHGRGQGISYLAGGRGVIVTVKVDSDLAHKLYRGHESEYPQEWWFEGRFIPKKNIVNIAPIWR